MLLASTLFESIRAELPTASASWGPDLDSRSVAACLLVGNVVRKFEGDEPISDAAYSAAIQKFVDANLRSAKFTRMGHVNTSLDELLIGEFSKSIHDFFSECGDAALISDNALEHFGAGRPGPGASIGTRATDMLHKMFDSSVSVTSRLLPYWEMCTTSEVTEPLSNAFFLARELRGIQVVESSKVSVVPKTVDVGRTIATEPSANMWMQRGLSSQIEQSLKWYYGLDLSNQQDKNRILAQKGSIDDSLVTLDLESASDSISLELLSFFPEWFRGLVMTYRSPSVEIEGYAEPIKLGMVSTMGNGFTFSLMTLIMTSVVHAVANLSGVRLTRWKAAHASRICADELPLTPGNWGVFGDDIICPARICRRVVRLLNLLGFIVNDSKSYVEGPFRESCGGDYYRGVDVRSVYIRHLETRGDLFVAFNSLSRWSALHGYDLSKTLRLILKQLKGSGRTVVPLHCNDDQGIKVPKRFLGSHQPLDQNGSILYKCWVPIPAVVLIHYDGLLRQRMVSPCRNVWGISQCLVAGVIRGGNVRVRIKDRKSLTYRLTRTVTPSWDTVCHRTGRFTPCPERLMDVLELAYI